MTKDVLVSISGKHIDIMDDPARGYEVGEDGIEVVTPANYYCRNGKHYKIEREILRSYFKPTKKAEKGLNSYSILATDKQIIFPYDQQGQLFTIDYMKSHFPGTFAYLRDHYDRLVPKCVSDQGIRDVPNATPDTWYQYGRTQVEEHKR